jgi:spermidine synthase
VFDKYMEKLRWKTFNNSLSLIASRDSSYQNIVLAEAQGQYSLFANGNFLGIYPDEYQSALRAHFFLCQHPFPQRVLLIGMGITGFLRQTLKHPVKSVDYVEFDPELVRMVSPILNAEDRAAMEDRRVTIFYMDGRRYVKKTARKYDVIIVDVPDPSTAMLNRFYTVNFFKEAREILTDSGILVTGISSAVNYVSPETADYNGSLFRGLQQVFPFVMVVPGERNYFFASARKGVLTDDPAALSKRYQHRNVHSKYFSAVLFQWLVQKDRIEFMEDALKTKADTLLNTDFHPVTYFYNLVIWDILSGAKGRRHIFQEIREKGVWWAAAPLGFVFILASILIIVKKPKRLVCFSNLWVISTTGFAGMSMEMILIFMFQSLYGYIYGKIGIVVALFMLGLAIGSLGMRSRLKKAEGTAMGTLIVLEIIICTYALAVPFLLRALAGTAYAGSGMFFSTEYIYFSLIFAIGLFVGMEFPLVCHLLIRNGYRSSSVAGWVDALDHIGAGVGALLTGTILLPLLGTYSTCLIVVFFKLTCIGFLIMTIKSDLLKT